jgi:hypothetical protein
VKRRIIASVRYVGCELCHHNDILSAYFQNEELEDFSIHHSWNL